MIRNPLKTAPKGLQESRGRKMLPERSEHGCFSKDSENPLSTYQKVCENNTSPLNYNHLNNKIIYRRPGIAANISFLEEWLIEKTAERPELKWIVINCRGINSIDETAIMGLEDLISN